MSCDSNAHCQANDLQFARRTPRRTRGDRPEGELTELQSLLGRLRRQIAPPTRAEQRRLRSLMTSAEQRTRPIAGGLHGRVAESLKRLEAVLDSPLDLDEAVFESLLAPLESKPSSRQAGVEQRPIRVDRAHRESRASAAPTTDRDGVAPPAEQMRRQTRSLQQQAAIVHGGLAGLERKRTRRDVPVDRVSAEAATEQATNGVESPSARSTLRGLHVRQGGHDFVIPIDRVERALAAENGHLATVQGRPIARIQGELCDVIHLAGYLGLLARVDLPPSTLIVIEEPGRKACLAIDEVVGPVDVPVTPLHGILPGVTSLRGVVPLESGRLALVPDFSRILA